MKPSGIVGPSRAIASTLDPAQRTRVFTLWGGFAGLLILMVVMALDSGLSLRKVTDASSKLRREARERDQLLEQLGSDLYHSGTVLRDYLLESDDSRAERQKEELEAIQTHINTILRDYSSKAPRNETGAVLELTANVDGYWGFLKPALAWSSNIRTENGPSFLRDTVIPRRTEVVNLVIRINLLNAKDFNAGEARLEEIEVGYRDRITWMSIAALVLGLVLACVVMRRVMHLERETAARYWEVEEGRVNLRRLSERLVTAQEEERRKIARELHDEIGQTVSATLVELGRIESFTGGVEGRQQRLATVRARLEDCVKSVRDMALLLRPSMLDDLGLVAALRWQARELSRRTQLNVRMITDEIGDDLPDDHKTCVYRIVQEALNNCAKHSRASHVRVSVRREEEGLSVTVEDDGVGFDPVREKGMGLLGMKERVTRLGGSLSIDASPGNGTILSIHVPIGQELAAV